MNVIREIKQMNERELELGISGSRSWHYEYRNSAYIFIGGLDYRLSEGDVILAFSQFGEVVDCNLVRDFETGKSRGFCFLAYEDQRSTIIAVDNMNGATLLQRTIRVDHAGKYRRPKQAGGRRDVNRGDPEFLEGSDDEEYDHRRRIVWDYEAHLAYDAIQRKLKGGVSVDAPAGVPPHTTGSNSTAVRSQGTELSHRSEALSGTDARTQRIKAVLAKRRARKAAEKASRKGKGPADSRVGGGASRRGGADTGRREDKDRKDRRDRNYRSDRRDRRDRKDHRNRRDHRDHRDHRDRTDRRRAQSPPSDRRRDRHDDRHSRSPRASERPRSRERRRR